MSDRRRPGNRAWAVFLLRLGLGLCLLFAGLAKFGIGGGKGYAETVQGLTAMFDGTILAGFPSASFASAIPFLEVGLGALLVLGLWTRVALVLAGLTLIGLTFGMVVKQNHEVVAHNLIYLLLDAVALALLDEGNALSLDGCCGAKPAP